MLSVQARTGGMDVYSVPPCTLARRMLALNILFLRSCGKMGTL